MSKTLILVAAMWLAIYALESAALVSLAGKTADTFNTISEALERVNNATR